jgi:hypothetical protein
MLQMNFGPKTKVTRSSRGQDTKTMRMIKRGKTDKDQSTIVDYRGLDNSLEDGSESQERGSEPLVRILFSGRMGCHSPALESF